MKNIAFGTLSIMLCATLVNAEGGLRPDTERGIVTFTVDSISADFFSKRSPVFTRNGIPGTLFVQTDPVGTEPWNMTWDDMRTLNDAGWEIGAHSYSHEHHLPAVEDEVLALELGAPAARLYRELGTYPDTFASPFGSFDERVLEHVRKYYDAHFGAWGNNGINEFMATDHFRVNRVEVSYEDSVDDICSNIKQAGEKGYWLVYMLHGVTDSEPGEYQIAHTVLEGIVACTAEMQRAGIVRVMTAADALREIPHTKK